MSDRYFEDKDHVSLYKDYRPVYSRDIYTVIIHYLNEKLAASARYPLAVDVGCGTGHQSTYQLLNYFEKVIGSDISAEMIKTAQQHADPTNRISFVESPAETLPVEDNSVSLVLTATALHWFDWPEFYAEVDRILVPNGVVACMTYHRYHRVLDHPNSDKIVSIMMETFDRPRERGFNKLGNNLLMDKYVDKSLQIPYMDKIRNDDLETMCTYSLKSFLTEAQTSSPLRRMFSTEPELSQSWWDDMVKRLMSAVGTDSLDTEIQYSSEVVLLMGRKPA